jgi:hypothetical protein
MGFKCQELEEIMFMLLLSNTEYMKVEIESERFWWLCITLRITGFMDFVHRPGILNN